MTKRYCPRGGAKCLNRHAKTLLASALILALNSAQALDLRPPENPDDWNGQGKWQSADIEDPEVNEYTLDSGSVTYDSISAIIHPLITNSEFFVSVESGASLTITGTTKISSTSSVFDSTSYDQGTYAFRATGGDSFNGGKIFLQGDIDVVVTHDLKAEDQLKTIGANVFYAQNNGVIEIGSAGTTTRAWVLASKPDVLSAKEGGVVNIKSTHNMFVGSIDTVSSPEAAISDKPERAYGTVTGTFYGEDSYWFGDEQSWNNAELISGDLAGRLIFSIGTSGAKKNEKIDLVFEKGAQWSYLNVNDTFFKEGEYEYKDTGIKIPYSIEIQSIAKRISNITLRNGGIINLFDKDLENKWKEIGLWDQLVKPDKIKHDYVRIGDLKGTDGIFRLDLDSDHPEESDMIFIEGTSETTQTRHWIEPYRPSQLVSVSADNTLTFALTQKDANNVTFADKMNIYGETLYDYELYVNHDEIGQEDLTGLEDQIKSNYEDFDDFDPTDYQGGTEWFIDRVVVSKSAATVGVNNAGWAAYDAIMQMDRRDRRLRETAFVDSNSNDGLWVRMQYGRLGAEDAYKSDTTTVHVGYERQTSDNNRFGVSVSYMDGSPDFENLKGGGDLERYEIAVYDTLTFGNHYLDFVGRFGHLSSDFSSSRSASSISTQGEFSTNYFGVSAEYGYTLKSAAGFFAEPQLQMQATRLEGYNYGLQRDMSVDVEQETALVGRAGLRLGKHFAGERSSGEIYVRGDLLHQFTDGQFGHIRDLDDVEALHWGDAGTWTNFGVGGYYQFANKFSMQLDLEKSAGGEQLDAWMVSGHLVYNF